jgi:hypothetical protein
MLRATTVNLSALSRVVKGLEGLRDLDWKPVLEEGERILAEGHRKMVLSGDDPEGKAHPVTMREIDPALSRRLGSGRPLAPNHEASRVIAWAVTDSGLESSTKDRRVYLIVIAWPSFTDRKGRNILDMHAHPSASAPDPRRNVLGVPREVLRTFTTRLADFARQAARRAARTG